MCARGRQSPDSRVPAPVRYQPLAFSPLTVLCPHPPCDQRTRASTPQAFPQGSQPVAANTATLQPFCGWALVFPDCPLPLPPGSLQLGSIYLVTTVCQGLATYPWQSGDAIVSVWEGPHTRERTQATMLRPMQYGTCHKPCQAVTAREALEDSGHRSLVQGGCSLLEGLLVLTDCGCCGEAGRDVCDRPRWTAGQPPLSSPQGLLTLPTEPYSGWSVGCRPRSPMSDACPSRATGPEGDGSRNG